MLPERRSAAVTASVCKASAGAVEHLPVAIVRNLADDSAVDYRGVDWSGGVVLVLGSEGRGLRPRVASSCDALVSLPVRGRIESLSVSAAAAVLLYAASAQQIAPS